MREDTPYDQKASENISDLKTFLSHIQPRVADGAFTVISACLNELATQVTEMQTAIKYAKDDLQAYKDGGDSKFIRDAKEYLDDVSEDSIS